MLGIQNSLPIANSVKFRGAVTEPSSERPFDIPDDEPDTFVKPITKEEIEAERDKKLADIEKTQADINDFAKSLENNPDKVSKKAGKLVRTGASILGLATAFVTAKYGAKISIGILKGVVNSKTAESAIKAGKTAMGPLGTGLKSIGSAWTKFVSHPVMSAFKKTSLGKNIAKFAEKPMVKNTLEKIAGYKEAAKVLTKSINREKVQGVVENTLAASTTASVLIDDLAGRNANKSNLDLALGTSGGDK